jgi:undecaprenyl pyrophosphate phosphatase UppP
VLKKIAIASVLIPGVTSVAGLILAPIFPGVKAFEAMAYAFFLAIAACFTVVPLCVVLAAVADRRAARQSRHG